MVSWFCLLKDRGYDLIFEDTISPGIYYFQPTMGKRKVYIDVTNTLWVDFISGIQKVTKSFVAESLRLDSYGLEVTPIYYCRYRKSWRHLSKLQLERLISYFDQPQPTIINRLKGAFRRHILYLFGNPKLEFEPGSIFLDMESVWINPVARNQLLPQLRSKGIKTGIFVHDIIPVTHPELIREETVAKFKAALNAHLDHSDFFIANSQVTAKELRRKFYEKIQDKELEVVPLAVDKLEAISRPIEGPYILHVGTIEIRKNHKLLLDAFDILRKADERLKLVMVGKKGWKTEEVIRRIQGHSEYGTKILWIENADDQMLHDLYANASVFVYPSLLEGYGLPVAEAMAHGIPVVCSDIPIMHEVTRGKGLFFKLGATGVLVELTANVLDNQVKLDYSDVLFTTWMEFAGDILGFIEQLE